MSEKGYRKGCKREVLRVYTRNPGVYLSRAELVEIIRTRRPDADWSDKVIGDAASALEREGILSRVRRGVYVYLGTRGPNREKVEVANGDDSSTPKTSTPKTKTSVPPRPSEPTPPAVGDLLEVIGFDHDNEPILRGEFGHLFRVRPL